MKLSELILAVGDDNVHLQNLDDCMIRSETRGSNSEVTFGTPRMILGDGLDDVCLIVWLPREAVEKAIATPIATPPSEGTEP